MKFANDQSDDAVLREIGNRITRYRLNQDKTQAALAHEAGVSHRTMIRAEHGHSVQASSLIRILRALQLVENLDALIPEPVQASSLIRILRALQLVENLDALIPEPAVSPVQQLKMQGKQRQRASSKLERPQKENTWSWGDEE